MSWKQVVAPRTGTQDGAGWCLRFAQSVFGAPARHASAWIAWQHAPGRHANRNFPTNVAVIVWFEHWGTYGSPASYGNWGHVAVWIPGRGYLSSPASGYGQQWFSTIESLERTFNAKYVGWSEGINGLRVIAKAAPAPTPSPVPNKEEDEDMAKAAGFYYTRKTDGAIVYLIVHALGSGVYHEYTDGKKGVSMPGSYNNPLAAALGTGSYTKVTESHARVIKQAEDRALTNKVTATVATVDQA